MFLNLRAYALNLKYRVNLFVCRNVGNLLNSLVDVCLVDVTDRRSVHRCNVAVCTCFIEAYRYRAEKMEAPEMKRSILQEISWV